ncbi:family 16 glycosylhydrolase [bacterium]|nr:family 16 glycosylhydrolase [bacterium]
MRSSLRAVFALFAVLVVAGTASAQVGALIWEDDFDDLANWIVITGNGSWGWGNGELEYYHEDNVAIADVAGEPGNTALRLTARQQSGAGIVDQWGNPLQYTSGKVLSRSLVSVRYGMIETRLRAPDLDLGGWPAVWMLGTANYAWPRSGEIDMMEMGGKQIYRDQHDTHNGGNGLDNATVNQSVQANALFYSDAAVNPGNPSGAASLSWDPDDVYARPYFSYDPELAGRWITYRLYWDETSLRFTVVDDGVEHDLFAEPFTIDAESDEFNAPFYFVANLAVGGAFTDAYNLGDPGSGAPVSMPFPAELDIDYIRVYAWNGQGEVHLGPPTFQQGVYGIFTDETPTSGRLVPEETAEIYVWEGTLADGTLAPYEGDNVLTWQTTGLGWFGAGIMSIQPLNLFDFPDGHLKFRIRIPANVTFKVGIIDAWGNQNWISFPAFQTTYGLVRDGQWGEAAIPVQDIRGTAMDLRMLSYPFAILEESGTACEFAIDDIRWDAGVISAVDGAAAPASRVQLLANAPNPFNALTELRFSLPRAGRYEIAIHDVSGRRVRTFTGVGEAGRNAVAWNGRDEGGAEVASGVYWYRVTTADGEASASMVLVK